MSNQTPRKHRSREQWHELVTQWQASGLSAPAFCAKNSVAYSSFSKWRQFFNAQTDQVPEVPPSFVDLSALPSGIAQGWQIILKLGHGVELELTQR